MDCCTLDNEGSDEYAMTRRERKKLQRRKTETKIEVSVKRSVPNERERQWHESARAHESKFPQ